MDHEFSKLTVIVAGGGGGIGRASALWFARRGARVFSGDIKHGETTEEERKLGISRIPCDARREMDVAELVRLAAFETSRVDIAVYSAGVEVLGQIPDIAEEDWDRCLDTNFKGGFFLAKHVIPVLASGGGGSITYISSNAGVLPRAHDPVYSVSKAALIALVRSLALCHAADRVRVNAVCPGPVENTGMMDDDVLAAADPRRRKQEVIDACPMARALGRMATPEEVADAIGYLASPSAAFLTGTILALDGAKSLGVPPYYRPAN